MPPIDRREFLKMLGVSAASATGLIACGKSGNGAGAPEMPAATGTDAMAEFYDLPMQGNARILHITDVHGQLKPVFFRAPNVNLGVGDAFGRPPHVVGKGLLKEMSLSPNTPESYVYTYLDFYNAARKYGRTGGRRSVSCPSSSFDTVRSESSRVRGHSPTKRSHKPRPRG